MTKQGLPECRVFGWNVCADTTAPTQLFQKAFTLNGSTEPDLTVLAWGFGNKAPK